MKNGKLLYFTSFLSGTATASFLLLSSFQLINTLFEGFRFLLYPAGLCFSIGIAIVIQSSIIEHFGKTFDAKLPVKRRLISLLLGLFYWLGSFSMGYSMPFVAISYLNYAEETKVEIEELVEFKINEYVSSVEAQQRTFLSLESHTQDLRKKEKKYGNTCRNKSTENGTGDVTNLYVADIKDFSENAKTLAVTLVDLESLKKIYQADGLDSAKATVSKLNNIVGSLDYKSVASFVDKRLQVDICDNFTVVSKLELLAKEKLQVLELEQFTTPFLVPVTLDVTKSLVLCVFTWSCSDLANYGLEIWFIPLLVLLMVDFAIIGNTAYRKSLEDKVSWDHYHACGRRGALFLIRQWYVPEKRHAIYVPLNTKVPIHGELYDLANSFAANEYLITDRVVDKITKKAETVLGIQNSINLSFMRYYITPWFWKQLNTAASAEDVPQSFLDITDEYHDNQRGNETVKQLPPPKP